MDAYVVSLHSEAIETNLYRCIRWSRAVQLSAVTEKLLGMIGAIDDDKNENFFSATVLLSRSLFAVFFSGFFCVHYSVFAGERAFRFFFSSFISAFSDFFAK